jgi:hypothetical protein
MLLVEAQRVQVPPYPGGQRPSLFLSGLAQSKEVKPPLQFLSLPLRVA